MEEEKNPIEKIVISTRIRLARNFAAYPFPSKMDEKQASDIVYLVERGLKKLEGKGDSASKEEEKFTRYDMATLSKEKAISLQEHYLISPALLKDKRGAAFVSKDETVSIMVNEEDHLRQQYIFKGFDLYKAYERISGLDEGLAVQFDFAYDKKLGYLTACPSNLGTGMRASVMMFLPGLSQSGGLRDYLPSLKADGMTVRGAFGEGTTADGYIYQISNERTLGVSERDILEQTIAATEYICQKEVEAREKMITCMRTETLDRCLRSYGILTHCATLSLKEFTQRIADVKLGMYFGFFEARDESGFEEFLETMNPASFRLNNKMLNAKEKECDAARAETVRNVLPELVRVIWEKV